MKLSWRAMRPAHISAVVAIAAVVHPGYPEDDIALAERLALYPQGCFVLTDGAEIVGYILSHPWIYGAPPKLNSLLKRLPKATDTYYVHDVALLPSARGHGAVADIMSQIFVLATKPGIRTIRLCAVNHSTLYWQRHGFSCPSHPNLSATLASYGTDVTFMARPIDQG